MTGKHGRQKSPDNDNPMDTLEPLKKKRQMLLLKILRVKKAVKEKAVSLNPTEIKCRLEILNSYIEQAISIQDELDIICSNEAESVELENACVSTKSLLLSFRERHRLPNPQETSMSVPHQSRLPQMRLPKFSGKYSEFKNFISLFESLVDNDPSLTEIEKFNHLLSCLTDEALGTVKAFQISEGNYAKALASLKKLYDNPCLIFFDSISKLFELPNMNKPSASSLRSMVDTVSAIYDSLLSVGDDKHIANAILIHLVMSKVDTVTKHKWEEQLNYNQLPLWSDGETILNKRFQHLSADEASTSRLQVNKPKHDAGNKKSAKSSYACSKSATAQETKCAFCRSSCHSLQNCTSFTVLSFPQRFEFVKNVPLCINCLKRGHTVSRWS